MDHNKQNKTKKFISEAPICSSKSKKFRKSISSHKADKYKVIVPTANISEEIYTKLNDINSTRYYANADGSARQSVIDNAFKDF